MEQFFQNYIIELQCMLTERYQHLITILDGPVKYNTPSNCNTVGINVMQAHIAANDFKSVLDEIKKMR